MFRDRERVRAGGGVSMTRSDFRTECDINEIVARYANGAQLPPTAADLVYGDVSEISDYKTCLDIVMSIKDKVAALPKKAAVIFSTDPGAFMASIELAKDREALVNLGLVEALPPVVADPPVVPDPPPGKPQE